MYHIIILTVFNFFFLFGVFRIYNFYAKRVISRLHAKESSTVESNNSISVIIPARNEEHRIGQLLKSLHDQTFYPLEVIIVDDHSTDMTANIVKNFPCRYFLLDDAAGSGKSSACAYGARQAQGDWLLFLDADVILTSDALAYLAKHIHNQVVYTVQPYHVTKQWYEQCSLYSNLVVFLGMELGTLHKPYKTTRGLFGPCIVFPKTLYDTVGGHNLVSSSIIEDMALGQILSQQGIPIISLPHQKKIQFRMYPEGLRTLFWGWAKNMSMGASKSNFRTIGIITGFMGLSIDIPLSLLRSIATGTTIEFWCMLSLYVLFALLLYDASRRLGSFSIFSCLFFPIFAIFYLLIFIVSLSMKLLHIPINWRGRKVFLS